MKKRKVILILYSQIKGAGAALELADNINKTYIDCYAVAIKDDEYIFGVKSQFNRFLHNLTLKNAVFSLKLYKAGNNWIAQRRFEKDFAMQTILKNYQTQDQKEEKNDVPNLADQSFFMKRSKGRNIILRFDPDVIVCMSPTANRIITQARKKLNITYPKVFAMMTDYVLDKDYITSLTDGYLVQNDDVEEALVVNKIEKEKIYIAGNPIKVDVISSEIKSQRRKEMQLPDDKPVLLITSGRVGANYLKDPITYLVDYQMDKDFTILVDVAGSSSLRKYCEIITKNKDIKIYCIDEKERSRLFEVADFAITSSQSFVSYECIARNIPFIAMTGTGKIQEGNKMYLCAHKLAQSGNTRAEVIHALREFLTNEQLVEEIKKNQQDFVQKFSCERTSSFLYKQATDQFLQKGNVIDKEIEIEDYLRKRTKLGAKAQENDESNESNENKQEVEEAK